MSYETPNSSVPLRMSNAKVMIISKDLPHRLHDNFELQFGQFCDAIPRSRDSQFQSIFGQCTTLERRRKSKRILAADSTQVRVGGENSLKSLLVGWRHFPNPHIWVLCPRRLAVQLIRFPVAYRGTWNSNGVQTRVIPRAL